MTSNFGKALAAFNNRLPPDSQLGVHEVSSVSQKSLSKKIDDAGFGKRLAEASIVDQATLLSECQDEAGWSPRLLQHGAIEGAGSAGCGICG